MADETRMLSAALAGHVRVLAEDIGDRNVWRLSRLALAARYIREWLSSLGYTPSRQRYEAMGIPVENLEVELPGTSKSKEIVIVGAHYDSVPTTMRRASRLSSSWRAHSRRIPSRARCASWPS
jgi:acetylornithine deacetylase/succinyl-diaminopimelate desuccinylase-like protein